MENKSYFFNDTPQIRPSNSPNIPCPSHSPNMPWPLPQHTQAAPPTYPTHSPTINTHVQYSFQLFHELYNYIVCQYITFKSNILGQCLLFLFHCININLYSMPDIFPLYFQWSLIQTIILFRTQEIELCTKLVEHIYIQPHTSDAAYHPVTMGLIGFEC